MVGCHRGGVTGAVGDGDGRGGGMLGILPRSAVMLGGFVPIAGGMLAAFARAAGPGIGIIARSEPGGTEPGAGLATPSMVGPGGTVSFASLAGSGGAIAGDTLALRGRDGAGSVLGRSSGGDKVFGRSNGGGKVSGRTGGSGSRIAEVLRDEAPPIPLCDGCGDAARNIGDPAKLGAGIAGMPSGPGGPARAPPGLRAPRGSTATTGRCGSSIGRPARAPSGGGAISRGSGCSNGAITPTGGGDGAGCVNGAGCDGAGCDRFAGREGRKRASGASRRPSRAPPIALAAPSPNTSIPGPNGTEACELGPTMTSPTATATPAIAQMITSLPSGLRSGRPIKLKVAMASVPSKSKAATPSSTYAAISNGWRSVSGLHVPSPPVLHSSPPCSPM